MATLEGWAVVPRISPWDEKHRDEIYLDHIYSRIGKTQQEAWRIQCQTNGVYLDAGELATRIQRWHDKGYRLVRVTVTIGKDHPHD